jgi:hypothetical protein
MKRGIRRLGYDDFGGNGSETVPAETSYFCYNKRKVSILGFEHHVSVTNPPLTDLPMFLILMMFIPNVPNAKLQPMI